MANRTRYTNRVSPGSVRAPGTAAAWWPEGEGTISELIEFGDVSALTGTVTIGTVPAGARYLWSNVQVITAFNAGANDALVVGLSSDTNFLVTDGHPTTADSETEGEIMDWLPTTDQTIIATYTHTSTAPTTGKAVVTVRFKLPL